MKKLNNRQNYLTALCAITGAMALSIGQCALALPEDAEQPVDVKYDNSLLLLDEGKEVYYGSPESPAEIIQGTLQITGQEITVERIDGEISRVTLKGSPAHYQQQPAIEQAIVMAEGETIILDYSAQHMQAIGKVRFSQGSDQWTGCQVDYYLETRQLRTPKCPDGTQATAVLGPRNSQ